MDLVHLFQWAKLARGLAIFCLLFRVHGGVLDSWTWRNPLPSAHPIFDVTFGSGKFVAVGEFDAIMTSTDAKSWTFQDLATSPFPSLFGRETLERVVFQGGRFIAWTGRDHGSLLLSSENGTNWIVSNLGARDLVDVVYGNGIFVAIANEDEWMQPRAAQVWTSTDAIHWVNRLTLEPSSSFWEGSNLVFAGGRFVIRPVSGLPGVEAQAFTSTNGEVWSPISIPESAPRFWRVCNFGDNAFTVSGTNILVSNDAVAWTARESGTTNELYSLSVSEGAIFAIGNSTLLRSTDGFSWLEQSPIPTDNFVFSVAGGNGGMAASTLKFSDARDVTFFSFPNGGPWVNLKSGASDFDFLSIDASDGIFVAGAHTEERPSREGVIATSHDGAGWTEAYHEPLAWFASITHGKGLFLAVGWSTAIDADLGTTFVISSPDGRIWGNRVDVDYGSFNSAAFGNGTFVIAGGLYFSEIASSPDAISWTSQRLDSDDTIASLAFGNGKFVAVGNSSQGVFEFGKTWTSQDGINWLDAEIPGVGGFNSVVFAEEQFVATASSGTIFTSTDGKQWLKKFENGDASFGQIKYGNGAFLAVDNPYRPLFSPFALGVYSSTDLTDWAYHSMPSYITTLSFASESFFAAGSNGTILQSGPILSARIVTAASADEGITLQIRGSPGQTVEIYRGTNLVEWNLLGTITLTSNAQTFLDTTSANSTLGFYKLGLPPQP